MVTEAPPTDTPTFEDDRQAEVATSSRADSHEVAVVGVSTAAALVVLRLVRTQIYTDPSTIDPWLYTALMTNFDFIYHHFVTTYYASRLPAILPGYFLNSFLTPQQAYVVLHIVFFLAGALFLYLLVRTLFGVRVAVLVYPAILTNAIYVNAHTSDYVDGFVITYLSGGLYFLASCTGIRSRARPALAGFFLAAAAMTNLFATLLVLAGVAAYLFVRSRTDRLAALARVAVEAAWFLTGVGLLLVACGLFAREHGGRFLFFVPSIDALSAINPADWKAPDYGWMRGEPRLFVPVFLAALVALAWRRRQRPEGERLGLALTVAGAGVVLILALWEFLGSGYFLQVWFYYDLLFPYFFVMLAAAVFALLGWASREVVASFAALAGIGLVVGAAPLAVVFGIERTELWGRGGAKIAVALMAATLLLALLLRLGLARGLTPAVALVAGALAIGSVGYASAANVSTHGLMANEGLLAEAGDVFSIGVQLMDFMERNGLQEGALPAFWYDYSRDPSLISLSSLYYYGFTLVSDEMPIPDSELRARLGALGAKLVVLLCVDPACGGGGAELRHAGYDPVLAAAGRLHAGSKSVWVEAYRLGA
jgi:hypothetical protein